MKFSRTVLFSVIITMLSLLTTFGAAFAATPVISGLAFSPTTGILRGGQTLTATIIANAAGYTPVAITINGKDVAPSFHDNANNTYTVTYTVAAGDTNILQEEQIPVSIILKDAGANQNLPYTTSPPATASPAINGSLADTIVTVPTSLSQLGLTGIAIDETNNKYYAASQTANQVYSIDMTTGVATVFAGTGAVGGYNGDSILATTAMLNEPTGIALDSTGNVYIADRLNHRIRKVDIATGLITTVAGNGNKGYFGEGAATSAALNQPTGITFDASDNLYIADNGNYRVRKVSGGTISTIAGDGTAPTLTPYSVALLPQSGTLYITDSGNNVIQKLESGSLTIVAGDKTIGYSGDGGLAIKAQLNQPTGIAIDKLGDIYFTDAINNSVRKIVIATGVISTRAGSVSNPTSLEPAIPATFNVPFGLTADSAGNLYVTQFNGTAIQKIYTSISAITTASPAGGSYTADTTVTLIANKTVKNIYYTLDASDPFSSATHIKYTGPFSLNATKIIKFASVDLADNLETTNTATYSIKKEAPLTTVTPAAGLYAAAQSVVITANPASATIYYTTNGIDPTTATLTKGVGSVTIPVNATTTIKFIAVGTDGTATAVQSMAYSIDTTAPTTSILPAAGLYNTSQTVTLTSSEPTATVYYSTSGIDPTTASTTKGVGSVSLAISQTTTLKYFSVDAAGNKEAVVTKTYTIDTVAPITTASPLAGIFNTPQSVTLTANDPAATIYYTTDGETVPTTATLTKGVGSVTIPVNATTILQYFAADVAGNKETVVSKTYTIDSVVPVTTPTVVGGTYNTIQTVNLNASKATATIYYTTTGTAPTTATTTKGIGSVSVSISKTTTLMYFAVDTAGNKETVKTQIYTIDTVAPTTTASALTGVYANSLTVSLTANDIAATIYYTIDGVTVPDATTPTKGVGTVAIPVNASTKLQYFAQDVAGNMESVKTQNYTIVNLTTTASPAGGNYITNQSVTLSSNSPGAAIYYTIDGTTPTVTMSGTVATPGKTTKKYTTPISISNTPSVTTVVQFFAIDKAGVAEAVKSETYLIDSVTPATTFECSSGGATTTIKLSADDSADPIPQIKFIVNTSGTVKSVPVAPYTLTDYTFPITITENTIIKFFAVDIAGNTEVLKTSFCALGASTTPSVYLETLPDAATTDAAATGRKLYVRGNVAPFATTTVTVNGTLVSSDTSNGSFSHQLTMPLAGNTLTVTATNGTDVTTVNRSISSGAATASTGVGSNNGVVGNRVRIPVTLQSGYQAAAVAFDITYNATNLKPLRAELAPAVNSLLKQIEYRTVAPNTFNLAITSQPSIPLPEGVIAYIIFDVIGGAGVTEPLTNSTLAINRLTDIGIKEMTASVTNGAVTIKALPGEINNPSAGVVTLPEVQQALWMLVDPIKHPVDGAVDLNADGSVSIDEFQKVLTTFINQII